MDHTYIEENDVIRRYLADRLSGDERSRFEAHYVDCTECLEQLELEEGFREGFREVAAAGAARTIERGLFLRLLLSRTGRALLAAALAIVVALPAGLLLMRNRDLGRRLAAAEAERARPAAPPRSSPEPPGIPDAQKVRWERDQLASALEQERRDRAAAEERLARAEAPRVNLPVFVLAAVRGGSDGSEDLNRLALAPGEDWVVLSVELALVEHATYRATLRTAAGKPVWSGDGLRPDERDTLTLALPSSLLPSGRYSLDVEGRTAAGRWEPVTRSPLRVERRE
ncbi:MAG TPA: hypothetical protein VEW48_14305 [Thermoanaerobaculia bacterium]|nr:hypothetical protein [Thermoanaerobaculia bacterium]